MQLKRFIGDNTPAALGMVRDALGNDAIILANRRVGDRVEIIATGQIDEDVLAVASAMEAGNDMAIGDVEQLAPSTPAPPARPVPSAPVHRAPTRAEPVTPPAMANTVIEGGDVPDDDLGVQVDLTSVPGMSSLLENDRDDEEPGASAAFEKLTEIASLSEDIEATKSSTRPIALAARGAAAAEASPAIAHQASGFRETLDGVSHRSARGQGTAADDDAAARSTPGSLQRILDRMDEQSGMFEQRFRKLEVRLWGEIEPGRSQHLKQLMHMGLGAELAVRLVERIAPDIALQEGLRKSLSLLKTTLPIADDSTLKEPGVTVVSGPAGAGKSTVLMKLAAQHVRAEGKQSLVMISTDTRRIGAFESLQAFGRLLGVPAVHARTSAELAGLIGAFGHKSLVLVDHTLPSESDALTLPSLPINRQGHTLLRSLLVLPATLQAAAADAVIARHRDTVDSCVLTNLDQCTRLGELFNALIRHTLPVAYWSDSSQVQNPLQRAEASVLVATAAAMGKRVPPTVDDDFLMTLIQPSRRVVDEDVMTEGVGIQ